MQLLDFGDGDIIEVLHDLLVCLDDFLLIFWLGNVLSRGGLLLVLAWLSWLECELTCEVLLRHLVRVLGVTVELIVKLVAHSILAHLA